MSKQSTNYNFCIPEATDPADITKLGQNWQELDDILHTQFIGEVKFIPDSTYPQCFYREVNGEKEWLNPPLVAGVEYRTSERHYNKPVYVKVLEFDELRNSDLFQSPTMQISVGDIAQLLLVTGSYVVGGPDGKGYISHNIPNRLSDAYYDAMQGQNNIFVEVQSAQTLRALELVVKYTKRG